MSYPAMSQYDWNRAPFNEPIRTMTKHKAVAEIDISDCATQQVQVEFEAYNDLSDTELQEEAEQAVWNVFPDTYINEIEVY